MKWKGVRKMKSMLFAGHGGSDSGASGYGLKEKNINLRATYALASCLVSGDDKHKVILGRNGDINFGPAIRIPIIKASTADVHISIHHNAGGGRGFESYIKRVPSEQDIKLQTSIHSYLKQTLALLDIPDRGMQRKNFYDLAYAPCPAIYLEMGFVDSIADMQVLTRPEAMITIMARIAEAIRYAIIY